MHTLVLQIAQEPTKAATCLAVAVGVSQMTMALRNQLSPTTQLQIHRPVSLKLSGQCSTTLCLATTDLTTKDLHKTLAVHRSVRLFLHHKGQPVCLVSFSHTLFLFSKQHNVGQIRMRMFLLFISGELL
jgi:hypothetical protein